MLQGAITNLRDARTMALRLAQFADIPEMHMVRLSVHENVLRSHVSVTPAMYRSMLMDRGRGWVDERDGRIGGFGVADQLTRNIWALFVAPGFEGNGIGRSLLAAMVTWLHEQSSAPIWLTTEPRSRAERFYRAAGWRDAGTTETGEIRFELTAPISN